MISKKTYYRCMFFSALVWNAIVVAGARTAAKRNPALKGASELSKLNTDLFLAMVSLLGSGYGLVGWDTTKNHSIVALGIVGKTMVFLILLRYVLQKKIPASTLTLGVVDLVYVGLFLEFLANNGKYQG